MQILNTEKIKQVQVAVAIDFVEHISFEEKLEFFENSFGKGGKMTTDPLRPDWACYTTQFNR